MVQKPREKSAYLDGLGGKRHRRTMSFDLPLARYVLKHKNTSTLLSKKGITRNFVTQDSKLYLNQEELGRLRRGEKIVRITGRMDSVNSCYGHRIIYNFPNLEFRKKASDPLYAQLQERYSNFRNYISDLASNSVQGVSMARMWNVSVVASLIFGMFLMTMIYRYLGQGAAAGSREPIPNPEYANTQVLGEKDLKGDDDAAIVQRIMAIEEEMKADSSDRNTFEKSLRGMVKGYPIEKMVPDIARQDKTVAAFLVAIAKKESDWGKHVPVYQGQDCYNYWGFRAQRDKMGTGGHTCFDSTSDAVSSVSKRIKALVDKEEIKTPQDMVVVWKCGYDCSWDSKAAVKKWVSDVEGYFDEVKEMKKD